MIARTINVTSARGIPLGWAVLLAMLALSSCGRPPAGSRTVTSAAQLRGLSPSQVQAVVSVRMTGVVTYSNRLSTSCFVQDSTGGIRVELAHGEVPPNVGWKVVVSGLAGSGGTAPSVVAARISSLGAAAMPAAVAVRSRELRDAQYEYRRVVLAGVVQAVKTEPGLMAIDLRAYGTAVRLEVPASSSLINDDWIDAEIRASGVLSGASGANGAAADPTLWAGDASAIQISNSARPPATLPVTPIHSLLALDRASLPAHRVRVRGAPGAAGGSSRPSRIAPDRFG